MAKDLDDMLGDIFDSRDIMARIDELELSAVEDEEGNFIFEDENDQDEYRRLKVIEEDASDSEDWGDGVTLIPDHRFEDYAREFAEDIGAISDDAAWPLYHIDWAAAADSLRMDYSYIEIEGTEYLYR